MKTAILDIPEVRERVHRLSVAQYERFVEQGAFGKKNELIRGLIIQKMSKSPRHFALSLGIYDRFKVQLPAGYSVRHEGPLQFADSEPEPDIAIVRGADTEFFDKHPSTAVLVVEVAISSAALDRENATLYAEAGVEEYWIVLPRDRQIEVYRRPESGIYREMQTVHEGAVECASIPSITVVLANLFG